MNVRETEQHTLWELVASVDAHNRINGGDRGPDAMSNEDFDDMLARHGK